MAARFLCLAFFGLFLAFSSVGAQTKEPLGPDRKAAVDAQGEPLPEGAKARLGSARFRFANHIGTAALSPDGKWLAASSTGDNLILADAATGKVVKRLPVNYGATALAFAPDCRHLGVVGYGNIIQIFDVSGKEPVVRVQAPQKNTRLTAFSFSADAKIIAAGTDNFGQNKNFVYLWEVAGGKPVKTLEVIQNAQVKTALSADGSVLATWGYFNVPAGLMGNNMPEQGRTIQLWNVAEGKELRKLVVERNNVLAAALSPDGKTLAAASGQATFHLFDVASGQELRRFAGRRGQTMLLQFSPDGKVLVAGSTEGTAQAWETQTGNRLGVTLAEDPRPVFAVAFPDKNSVWALGSTGNALSLVNVLTGKSLTPTGGHLYWVRNLAYSGDGKTLLSAGADGKLCWWDAATGAELRHLTVRDDDRSRGYGFPGHVRNFAISRDGKYLATSGDHGLGGIRLWDLAKVKVLCDFDAARANGPGGVAFSPDGARLAAFGSKAVLVWDVNTGRELPALPFKVDADTLGGMNASGLAFSPDGKTLAAARTYYERNTGNATSEVYLWNTAKSAAIASIQRAGHVFGRGLAFSPDSQVLALPTEGRSVLLLKAASGKELGRLEGSQTSAVQALAFSPDGRLLAGAQVGDYYISRPTAEFSPNRERIILWEIASGQIRQELPGHHGAISCLAFAPDGKTLASGASDTTILLWDLAGPPSVKFGPFKSPRAPGGKGVGSEGIDLDAAWADLAGMNARSAYKDLMARLIAAPEVAMDLFKKNLRPAKSPNISAAGIDRLIADLDHESFTLRIKASAALEQLGETAGPALRKANEKQPSLEAERRLKSLLDKLDKGTLTPDEVRLVRAVEVLEKVGSPEALAILENLAQGAPAARLTVEARQALGRMQDGK